MKGILQEVKMSDSRCANKSLLSKSQNIHIHNCKEFHGHEHPTKIQIVYDVTLGPHIKIKYFYTGACFLSQHSESEAGGSLRPEHLDMKFQNSHNCREGFCLKKLERMKICQ